MPDVIFALPRTDYSSYSDLYDLIDLSGYATCFIDEVRPESEDCYILTVRNEESAAGWPASKAKIVLWDLEWRTGPQPPIPGVTEEWFMDKRQAEICGGRYVPIGSHPGLKYPGDTPREDIYDAAFLAYIVPRRQGVLTKLYEYGLRLPKTSAWGEERNTLLCSSRVYLHVHQLEAHPGVPGLRMAVAAAYSMPVIAESFSDPGIFTASRLMTADYNYLAEFVRMWARDRYAPEMLADFGRSLHDLLCVRHSFKSFVEGAL